MFPNPVQPDQLSRKCVNTLAVHAILLLLAAGCESGARPTEGLRQTGENEGPSAPVPSIAYQYPGSPPVLDAEGLRTFVGRFRNNVVLMDFWASWSQKSVTDLRALARMQEQLAEENFQIVSCNLDEPGVWSTQTLPTLKRTGANFPCIVIRPESKPGIRAWLNPKWCYDLPARFVIDEQGRVLAGAMSGAALATTQDQVRRALSGTDAGPKLGRLPTGAGALRGKLIDLRTGRAESLAEVLAKPADPRRLGEQLTDLLAARLDPGKNPRIAVLPFPSSEARHRAGAFGVQTGQAVVEGLTRRGYRGLPSVEEVQQRFDRTDLTLMTVDFDANLAVDRLPYDYLVIGWLRGAAGERSVPQSLAAEDDPGNEPRDSRSP